MQQQEIKLAKTVIYLKSHGGAVKGYECYLPIDERTKLDTDLLAYLNDPKTAPGAGTYSGRAEANDKAHRTHLTVVFCEVALIGGEHPEDPD